MLTCKAAGSRWAQTAHDEDCRLGSWSRCSDSSRLPVQFRWLGSLVQPSQLALLCLAPMLQLLRSWHMLP